MKRPRPTLVIGVILYACAVALTPGEVSAAQRGERVTKLTALTLVAYLAAAILTLQGLSPAVALSSEPTAR